MTPERWQEIEKVYHSALELAENERPAFLERACAGDERLRREVESLLADEEQARSFIEAPALAIAVQGQAQEHAHSWAGQQMGFYKILSLLGSGGMGEVYLAHDSRLDRTIALKILPAELASDQDRMRRFIREARAASALKHPNVTHIYDMGESEGVHFIAMEYVEGKTLAAKISGRPLKPAEIVEIGLQVADALDDAHSKGITHRDIKPANLMLTCRGKVKVLDFGLAKMTRPEGQNVSSDISTIVSTEPGVVMGTVKYMSPEQMLGQEVDHRTDIFSVGVVLYEMATGSLPFKGDTATALSDAILHKPPTAPGRVNPELPIDLDRIILRALEKDRELRYQTASDLRAELKRLKRELDSGSSSSTVAVTQVPTIAKGSRPLLERWPLILVVGMFGALLGASVWFYRSTIKVPEAPLVAVPLTSYPGQERQPSFSPDGNQVAFSWNGEKQDNFDIYVKLIGSPKPVRLSTDPARDISPAFSPDGRSIGFVRVSRGRATFIVIPAIGGPERPIAEVTPPPFVLAPLFAWLPDGKWVVVDGLALLSTETGETGSLSSPPTKSSADFSPAVSLDGRTVAFSRSGGFGVSDIYLLDLTEDLKPKGEPRRLTSLKGMSFGSAWTPNGREIIFISGVLGSGMSLRKTQASGVGESEQLPFSGGEVSWPAISRSGNRLAYEQWVENGNIWHLSLSSPGVASGPPSRIIASTRMEMAAQYSPDGKRIAFESRRSGVSGIWISDADGSNAVELFPQTNRACGTPRWSPDGQHVGFASSMEGNINIYTIRASGGKPLRLTTGSAGDDAPSWSRDGKWVYFTSNQTGRWEVWKVLAGGGEAVQVTRNGGGLALESLDGQSIYYMKGLFSGSLWKMPLSGGEESQVLPSVANRAFSLVNEGIYFIPEPGADRKTSIQFLSFTTGKVKTVAPISEPPNEGLSVSSDGRSLLFSQFDEAGSDLMLVENFR